MENAQQNYAMASTTSSSFRPRHRMFTLAEIFTVAATLYTLTDRKPSKGVRDT